MTSHSDHSRRRPTLVVLVDGATPIETSALVASTFPAQTMPWSVNGDLPGHDPWHDWSARLPARALRQRGIDIDRASATIRPTWRGDLAAMQRLARRSRGVADLSVLHIRELSGAAFQPRREAQLLETTGLIQELVGVFAEALELRPEAIDVVALSAGEETRCERAIDALGRVRTCLHPLTRRPESSLFCARMQPHAVTLSRLDSAARRGVVRAVQTDPVLAVHCALAVGRHPDEIVIHSNGDVALYETATSMPAQELTGVVHVAGQLANDGIVPAAQCDMTAWTRRLLRGIANAPTEPVDEAPVTEEELDLLEAIAADTRARIDEVTARLRAAAEKPSAVESP